MKEIDKNMYFGAKAITIETAKMLRNNMTYHENLLWEKLKGKQIYGVRFRRQHPIMFFIADFYCHEAKLVVEVDGDIHNDKTDYDDGRSAEMEKYGLIVLRITNAEVETSLENVIYKIKTSVNERLKSPPWGI
jgi:cyclase